MTQKQRKVVEFCSMPRSGKEIIEFLGMSYQSKNVKRYVTDLLTADYLRPVYKRKPNDPYRKYIAGKMN